MPNSFTPQQIEEFLQEFFDVVGTRQYTGARYVPIFGRAGSDTVEWDNLEPYEPLTVVMHEGVSYVSRRYVPRGIQITDTAYWAQTYRFNAQVEEYRQEVLSFQGQIDQLRDAMESDYVPFPDPNTYPKYGTLGQVLTTLTDGTTKWEDPVTVDADVAEPLIEAWLDDHPEATTTVQDDSITDAKIYSASGILRDNGTLSPTNPQFTDANTYYTAGTLRLSSALSESDVANLPQYELAGILTVIRTSTNLAQQIAQYTDGNAYIRFVYGGNATDWINIGTIANGSITDAKINSASGILRDNGTFNVNNPQFTDANTYYTAGTLRLSTAITALVAANLPEYGYAGILTVIPTSSILAQQIAQYTNGNAYIRFVYGGNATSWIKLNPFNSFSRIITVGTNCDYATVSDAVAAANSGDTIFVFPGTYNETVRMFTKELNIIGMNKQTCVIQSTSGLYTDPALEATMGHFENLTFKAKYVSGVSSEIGTSTNGAYAVHVECSKNSPLPSGMRIEFVNCNFESDFFPALGCGCGADWTIDIQDCEIVSNQPATRGNYATEGGLGAMFVHDPSGTPKGSANVKIRDSVIRSTILSRSMTLYDTNTVNNSVNFEFVNNTVYSAVLGFADSIWWRGRQTAFDGNLHLLPWSHGNTETELNA